MNTPSTKSAFSLVELSIVLVILGLLVGGILSGKSLIRASELRSVTQEYQLYMAATLSFRDKYFALPGDMPNATSVWGAFSTGTCPTGTGNGSETCDGNGNGQIESGVIGQASEMFGYWVQLANAGLIQGKYTGKAGSGGTQHSIIDTNVPRSKIAPMGWSIQYIGVLSNANFMSAGDYGNVLFMGAAANNAKTFSGTEALTPAELWNIDTKTDDGMPGYGKIMTLKTSAPSWAAGCTNTDLITTAQYDTTNEKKVCSVLFRNVF